MNVIADGDPSFWVKWSCVRKQSTVEDVLEYYAIRLMIQSRQEKYGKGNGRNPFRTFYHKKVHDMFPVNAQIMTADDFGSLSNKVIIPCSYARGALSEHLSSLIEGGQSLALDERMHPWRGKSPCVRKIPSKPNPVGHWTMQMCLRMSHPIPYCCGMFPFDQDKGSAEKIVLDDVAAWAVSLQKYKEARMPIIVTDSYYFTKATHGVYADERYPYISAVKVDRMDNIITELKSRVDAPGKFCAAHNTGTNEVVVHYYSRNKDVGRKTVYSNAFSVIHSQNQPSTRPPVWGEYKELCSGCETFNRMVAAYKWPYNRKHWTQNFDDVFVTSMFINVFSICKELKCISDTEEFHDFGSKLSISVIKELRKYEKVTKAFLLSWCVKWSDTVVSWRVWI